MGTPQKKYHVVTPEDISLVGPSHICNNTPPQYTVDGDYIPPTHDRVEGWRIAYSDEYPDGYYVNLDSAEGAKAIHYFNNKKSRMPKPTILNDRNRWQYRECGAITEIFGGPDAHIQKPWSEDLQYDEFGGYDTYYPEGMVDSVNGISLGEYINGDSYVPCWGLTDVVDGTDGSDDFRNTEGNPKGQNVMEHTNNKYDARAPYHDDDTQTYGPGAGGNVYFRPGRNPYTDNGGSGIYPWPDQTLSGEKNRHHGLPHDLDTNDPYGRPSHGYHGISFGAFQHATPDIPKIIRAFPNNWGRAQSDVNTTFTASDSFSSGATQAANTGLRFEFSLPNNIERALPPVEENTFNAYYNRDNLAENSHDESEGGRWLKVEVYSPGANGDNWDSENYGAIGSSSSGGIPFNMTYESQYINFENFDWDDVYSKVKVDFDGNMYSSGTWDGGMGVMIRVKLFDAISGTWSNTITTLFDNPGQAAGRWVPIGHFVPYYVDKNDDKWLFWNDSYTGGQGGDPTDDIETWHHHPNQYSNNGPMERFMAGFWDIYKNSAGNWSMSNNVNNSKNLFRHFCITKAKVWYGVHGSDATNGSAYVQLGNGSNDDRFRITCRFQFPGLVGKHVIAGGLLSSHKLTGGGTMTAIDAAGSKQRDAGSAPNTIKALHPDFFEQYNGSPQGDSDRHRRWVVAKNTGHYAQDDVVTNMSNADTLTSYHIGSFSHPTLATSRPAAPVFDSDGYDDGLPDLSNLILRTTGYAHPVGYKDVITTRVGQNAMIRATFQEAGHGGHVGDYII